MTSCACELLRRQVYLVSKQKNSETWIKEKGAGPASGKTQNRTPCIRKLYVWITVKTVSQ